ncbi:MAG: cyclic pyranopterin monophosphate synthase MoaC [Thermogemmata sp.]|uniref:Cyclic pyranopterin monophosphate synthase n=1 Tax=Thermogemmata fonticola TaxID=2755323 RepID=A0A7V8VEJ0_9BACT|nr:cyclic pyranopterin monophosphate synthase MoaC [Thermogemmata fonticola]MBA2226588.1 cyclic pyranopterin monophosphate synthase MoaC [Thermogemmata fonticola]MCX8140884.1 cyclic pyranopterin monophosphate synthase MoaC [Gemmataceae bacterium]
MSEASFSHLDAQGAIRMVDVGDKEVTDRLARASARVRMQPQTLQAIREQQLPKGAVLETARLAGILAAKKTAELIPLCHPLPITAIHIDFAEEGEDSLRIEATVRVRGQTGVEMEALTAVSIAALTVYDMCKSLDRSMSIEDIRLEEKSGGRSGHYQRAKTDVEPPRE